MITKQKANDTIIIDFKLSKASYQRMNERAKKGLREWTKVELLELLS